MLLVPVVYFAVIVLSLAVLLRSVVECVVLCVSVLLVSVDGFAVWLLSFF